MSMLADLLSLGLSAAAGAAMVGLWTRRRGTGPSDADRRRLEQTIADLRLSLIELEEGTRDHEAELHGRLEELEPLAAEVPELRARLAEAEAELALHEAGGAADAGAALELARLRDEYEAALWQLEALEREVGRDADPRRSSGGSGSVGGPVGIGELMKPEGPAFDRRARVPTLAALVRALEDDADVPALERRRPIDGGKDR